MGEVLILVDHVDGKLRKTTAETLTIARRLGEPWLLASARVPRLRRSPSPSTARARSTSSTTRPR